VTRERLKESMEISIVRLEPGVGQAMGSLLSSRGEHRPLRIHLHFSGCCDPSLYVCPAARHDADLIQELEWLTFIMDPETYQLVGEVTISCVEERDERGFVLTPQKPVSPGREAGARAIVIRSTL
jgi:Fe-S cluster assembly iron-binding protein IscA